MRSRPIGRARPLKASILACLLEYCLFRTWVNFPSRFESRRRAGIPYRVLQSAGCSTGIANLPGSVRPQDRQSVRQKQFWLFPSVDLSGPDRRSNSPRHLALSRLCIGSLWAVGHLQTRADATYTAVIQCRSIFQQAAFQLPFCRFLFVSCFLQIVPGCLSPRSSAARRRLPALLPI